LFAQSLYKGCVPDTIGVYTLGTALVQFAVGCATSMPESVIYKGVSVEVHYYPGFGYFAYWFCWWVQVCRVVLHWVVPVPGGGKQSSLYSKILKRTEDFVASAASVTMETSAIVMTKTIETGTIFVNKTVETAEEAGGFVLARSSSFVSKEAARWNQLKHSLTFVAALGNTKSSVAPDLGGEEGLPLEPPTAVMDASPSLVLRSVSEESVGLPAASRKEAAVQDGGGKKGDEHKEDLLI